MLWDTHEAYVFEADSFEGQPIFYPVFNWKNLYSFSPLALAVNRGWFVPSEAFLAENDFLRFDPVPANLFADAEIRRIGGPPHFSGQRTDLEEFSVAMAQAMQADIKEIETKNLDKRNIILCGGKDSLNLLLLEWRNPVTVYSAQPNFPLVQDFVEANGLNFEVCELTDKQDDSLRDREIAESFCAVDLVHWKWTVHLRDISSLNATNVIFWKGQVADAFLTDYWRSYTYRQSAMYSKLLKAQKRAARLAPRLIDSVTGHARIAEFERSLWLRAAVNQGFHLGFLRSITDALVLSGYHGPRTSKAWQSLDLRCIAGTDVRPMIGRVLHGREVRYPDQNPSPPPSTLRNGYRDPALFRQALASFGVEIRAPGVN